MLERSVARKVAVASVTRGTWEKQEGMTASYVITPGGEQVARARILATVVGKFVAEDQLFASITLDDGTDTIRAKVFKTTKPIGDLPLGAIVDLIGKVKEYNGELYLIPEVVQVVENPNLELLRELELLAKGRAAGAAPAAPKNDLRPKLLQLIEQAKDGLTYDALIQQSGSPEQEVEQVVNDLLGEGICYEPTPGKIRKI
ncbi:MAG: hypothetical protein HY520_03795 [Candidatus Aenigmarchaeota archaeon]|nr:hypothetical protein [Candidatus Aenigmarchaeota archaeon]